MKIFLPGAGARMIPSLRSVAGVEEVIVSLTDPFAAGNFLADKSYRLPRFDQPGFAEGVLEIHEREKFDICIPVVDAALLAFLRPEAALLDGQFPIAMSPRAVVEIATDKLESRDLFLRCGLDTPATWTLPQFQSLPDRPFPAFLKPRHAELRDFGQGTYQRLEGPLDADYWAQRLGRLAEGHVVQPLLTGREINVNFFCDAGGRVRSIVPIARLAGEPGRAMTRGEILDDSRFDSILLRLATEVRFWGSNELQIILEPDGTIWCMEINVRLNGGSPFLQAAGVDHFANLLRLVKNEPLDFPAKPGLLRMTSWENIHTFTGTRLREMS